MFGRATIRLGIGPHSSVVTLFHGPRKLVIWSSSVYMLTIHVAVNAIFGKIGIGSSEEIVSQIS